MIGVGVVVVVVGVVVVVMLSIMMVVSVGDVRWLSRFMVLLRW